MKFERSGNTLNLPLVTYCVPRIPRAPVRYKNVYASYIVNGRKVHWIHATDLSKP